MRERMLRLLAIGKKAELVSEAVVQQHPAAITILDLRLRQHAADLGQPVARRRNEAVTTLPGLNIVLSAPTDTLVDPAS
jgi:hypothetical protein